MCISFGRKDEMKTGPLNRGQAVRVDKCEDRSETLLKFVASR